MTHIYCRCVILDALLADMVRDANTWAQILPWAQLVSKNFATHRKFLKMLIALVGAFLLLQKITMQLAELLIFSTFRKF